MGHFGKALESFGTSYWDVRNWIGNLRKDFGSKVHIEFGNRWKAFSFRILSFLVGRADNPLNASVRSWLSLSCIIFNSVRENENTGAYRSLGFRSADYSLAIIPSPNIENKNLISNFSCHGTDSFIHGTDMK